MKKKFDEKENLEKIITVLYALLGALLIVLAVITINVSDLKKNNIIIPKNTVGIVYSIDGSNAIIKLNMTDTKQAYLLGQIELFCEKYEVKDCKGFKFP